MIKYRAIALALGFTFWACKTLVFRESVCLPESDPGKYIVIARLVFVALEETVIFKRYSA